MTISFRKYVSTAETTFVIYDKKLTLQISDDLDFTGFFVSSEEET